MREPIEEACQTHTDLSVFSIVVSILESGAVYTRSGQKTAATITKLCEKEIQRQLRKHDAAVAIVKGGAGPK